ncbi:MAG: metallophosphoesterase family protein [Deltaproteobacteria bacterium]|nr:metallophosphoesterase family protein [Deltaproteobacteria bacterium]
MNACRFSGKEPSIWWPETMTLEPWAKPRWMTAAIVWTGRELRPEHQAFLRKLPLVRVEKGFTLVHSSPHEPGTWPYIFSILEAVRGFRALTGDVAFVGHSHFPVIFAQTEEGKIESLAARALVLNEGVRYIINVGSVGQPRDGDPRAAYGLFDGAPARYRLKRVAYDIPAAQRKIIQAGLPVSLAERLSRGA